MGRRAKGYSFLWCSSRETPYLRKSQSSCVGLRQAEESQATMLVMHRAMDNYEKMTWNSNSISNSNSITNSITNSTYDYKLMVDGNTFIAYKDYTYETLVGGDDLVLEISLASIFAKEERDDLVRKAVSENAELESYGLLTNMGYGTKKHCQALIDRCYDPKEHR